MSSPVEINIRFDGRTPGLTSHRLSIAAFHAALHKLLIALRQTADSVAQGRIRQRSGKLGKKFDLQIATISDGCVNLKLQWGPTDTSELDESSSEFELARKSAKAFVDSLDNEWNSTESDNNAVRKFLRALPEGVEIQEYEAKAGTEVLSKTVLRTRGAIEPTSDWRATVPRLREFRGRIDLIRFGQRGGKGRVRVRELPSNDLHNCGASEELIDLAAKLHKETVIVKVLMHQDFQELLIIRSYNEPESIPTAEERQKHLFERWKNTLDKLAE